MKTILAVLMFLFPAVAMGQSKSADQDSTTKEALSELLRNMPSEKELSELLAKADQKVSSFEDAVKIAKPHLDAVDTKYAKNYLDAASTAHFLIATAIKNGSSAYRLLAVLTTLDDLSFDAATGSTFLLAADEDQVVRKGAAPDAGAQSAVLVLTTAGTACNDIAELIFHATMRLVDAEETFLFKILRIKK